MHKPRMLFMIQDLVTYHESPTVNPKIRDTASTQLNSSSIIGTLYVLSSEGFPVNGNNFLLKPWTMISLITIAALKELIIDTMNSKTLPIYSISMNIVIKTRLAPRQKVKA